MMLLDEQQIRGQAEFRRNYNTTDSIFAMNSVPRAFVEKGINGIYEFN